MNYLPDWVRREIEELRRAPFGSAALLIIGIAVGLSVGRWYYANLYSERINILETKVRTMEAPSSAATTDASAAPAVRGFLIKISEASQERCTTTLDGRAIRDFSDKYDMFVICGIVDQAVDKLQDPRISVSHPFTIIPAEVVVSVDYYGPMLDAIQQIQKTSVQQQSAEVIRQLKPAPKGTVEVRVLGVSIGIWREVVVVPKGTTEKEIKQLSDVRRFGGKILSLDASTRIMQ